MALDAVIVDRIRMELSFLFVGQLLIFGGFRFAGVLVALDTILDIVSGLEFR